MPYGKIAVSSIPHVEGISYPSSLATNWQTVIAAGGVNVQDAATITNPDTQINTSATVTKFVFAAKGSGTNLVLRLSMIPL
jgi:hypothetical protein